MARAARDLRVQVSLSAEELDLIDEWRHNKRIATRSDAIRRMCQMAMTLDEDLDAALDQSEDMLKDFEEALTVLEQDMAAVKEQAGPDTSHEDKELNDLLLFNLRAVFHNTADLYDHFIWVYYHWLELNNVAQVVAQAGNRRAAVKAMMSERDRLHDVRTDLLERRARSLEINIDATMPLETMLPLSKGKPRPKRVKMLHTKGVPDVSSEA